jgi:hypothetical protein
MVAAASLDCSNYGLVTYYFAQFVAEKFSTLPIAFVGWDGGVIGNHQTLFIHLAQGRPGLMLDPTLGIACLASFDEVAAGKQLEPSAIAVIGATPQLDDSRDNFLRALLAGAFRPSDLLYYFQSAEDYLERYSDPLFWPTPAARLIRERARIEAELCSAQGS